MTDIDERALRNAMGNFCTGVVIATGMDGTTPVGFAAQSFVSLSLDPPLVALCPGNSSTSWPKIKSSGHFCINILGQDQKPICDVMARSGGDKFADVNWRTEQTGAPILEGVVGFVECELEDEHAAGDHTIAVGRVVNFEVVDQSAAPLLFFKGSYGGFQAL